jgi:uncharacterized membrane protein
MAQATLTVWRFDAAGAADEAAGMLDRLVDEHVLSVVDAATVTWEREKKNPKTRQLTSTTVGGALGEAFWGMLFGLIFFVPLIGAAVGAATGALTGSMADVGIDDSFINKVRDQVTPGTSALFLMTSDVAVDELRDAFAGHGPFELIFTKLSSEQEQALREVFERD